MVVCMDVSLLFSSDNNGSMDVSSLFSSDNNGYMYGFVVVVFK